MQIALRVFLFYGTSEARNIWSTFGVRVRRRVVKHRNVKDGYSVSRFSKQSLLFFRRSSLGRRYYGLQSRCLFSLCAARLVK